MRGCSGKSGKIPTHSHVFPAYAGMFHAVGGAREGDNGFPRVCGDVPAPRRLLSLGAEVFPAYAGMFRH